MNIINRRKVATQAIKDMELIVTCMNDDVHKFCYDNNWDVNSFLDELYEE